jgi:hypothetical protein
MDEALLNRFLDEAHAITSDTDVPVKVVVSRGSSGQLQPAFLFFRRDLPEKSMGAIGIVVDKGDMSPRVDAAVKALRDFIRDEMPKKAA